MVNSRLMWVLEFERLLAMAQYGLEPPQKKKQQQQQTNKQKQQTTTTNKQKNLSTADHLVRFDGYIRNDFDAKEHVIAFF